MAETFADLMALKELAQQLQSSFSTRQSTTSNGAALFLQPAAGLQYVKPEEFTGSEQVLSSLERAKGLTAESPSIKKSGIDAEIETIIKNFSGANRAISDVGAFLTRLVELYEQTEKGLCSRLDATMTGVDQERWDYLNPTLADLRAYGRGLSNEVHRTYTVGGYTFGFDLEVGGLAYSVFNGRLTWQDAIELRNSGMGSARFGGALLTTRITLRSGTLDENRHFIIATSTGNVGAAAGLADPSTEGVRGYDVSASVTQLSVGLGTTTGGMRESYFANAVIGGKGSTINATRDENGATINYAPSFLKYKSKGGDLGLGFTYEEDYEVWHKMHGKKNGNQKNGR